jgi:hypothetical protein
VASWINLDLAEALHRLAPQFLKAFCQTVCEFAIPDEQRRKSALLVGAASLEKGRTVMMDVRFLELHTRHHGKQMPDRH